jgi:mRNA interferase YafQ
MRENPLNEEKLPTKNRDHVLKGNYNNRRECHIEPDWLLIYKRDTTLIIFERTGTHSDLFKD